MKNFFIFSRVDTEDVVVVKIPDYMVYSAIALKGGKISSSLQSGSAFISTEDRLPFPHSSMDSVNTTFEYEQ